MFGLEILAIFIIILVCFFNTISKSERKIKKLRFNGLEKECKKSCIDHLNKRESEAEPEKKSEVDEDYENFNSFFEQIRRDLTTDDDPMLTDVMKRIDKAFMYTVGDGKKFRAMTIVKCLKNLVPPEKMNTKLRKMNYAFGWSLELIQAAFLMYDDIMDNSLTRRGKQCWYLHENNGVLAINDGSLLRIIKHKILKKYCSKHPCYLQLVGLFLETSRKTLDGQIMDCMTTPDGKRDYFSLLNETRYETIVKYKTSYYTFIIPVRAAMYFANITDENMHADAETLLLRIGHLFQAQDDYLDIYGDPNVTGKVGTDIEDGKCSWIAVRAYKMMGPKTKKIFEENYGRKENVATIKGIYESLDMRTVFKAYEKDEFVDIRNMISKFEQKYQISLTAVNNVLNKIFNRKK